MPTRRRAFGLRLGSPEEVLSASLWWTYRNTKAKRELGFAPRPHEQTLEDAVEWQLAELGGRRGAGLAARARRARALRAGRRLTAARLEPRIVLYRCPTRTNVLCPCGAVERRLRKLKLEHRTDRLPYNKRARPEIEELTGQRRVPVLVDGDEVIADSKRILQYLDWKYGSTPERPKKSQKSR